MTSFHKQVSELTFDTIAIGDVFELDWSFSREDVLRFAELSGDFSPLHVNVAYAETTEFGQPVVHGMLLASLFSNMVGMKIPGKLALYLGQDLAFRKPVYIGESLKVRAKVTARNVGTATISLATEIRNSRDIIVVSGTGKVKIRDTQQIVANSPPTTITPAQKSDCPIAVVTGASKGLGAAIARKLANQGYICILVYRSSDHDAGIVQRDIESAGGIAIPFKADIANDEDLDLLETMVRKEYGRVSALVNGAIGDLSLVPIMELHWSDFEYYFNTQVKAVLGLSQRLSPLMQNNGGGSIVNILSQVVHNTPPVEMAHYVTAKYALMGLSKAMASEWAQKKIRVNNISPGLARTSLTQHYQEKIFKMEALKTPLGRLVDVDDIANTVSFLLSDDAAFMTGSNLFLTGGSDMP